MKKYLLTLALFNLFIIATTAQNSNSESSVTKEGQLLLDESIQGGYSMGISAGIIKDGKIHWTGGAGLSDSKLSTSFNATTKTRIASIAKPMTAIAIMQLYENGKIDLDDPIHKYIQDYPQDEKGEITIRQLLSHSSGIDGYQSNKERENKVNYSSLTKAADIFKNRPLLFTPGEQFHYTSYGYVVLGLVIERVTEMPYESYMEENIWNPAGMYNTGIEYPDNEPENKSLLYHRSSNGKIKQAKPTDLTDRIPGGGIYSTSEDILLFAKAVLNDTYINRSTLDIMITDTGLKKEGNPYGFGWYLYGENPSFGFVFGHNGAQIGASTFLFILPEVETAVIVLSNTSGAMQEVSNIGVRLFDLAALFEN